MSNYCRYRLAGIFLAWRWRRRRAIQGKSRSMCSILVTDRADEAAEWARLLLLDLPAECSREFFSFLCSADDPFSFAPFPSWSEDLRSCEEEDDDLSPSSSHLVSFLSDLFVSFSWNRGLQIP
ncbi:unnamed protein product [Spirodela intermedia]|uniref:Uncharacterized protein n=1 Tax=Spirodela intermedia TaxID=51605 RepID=A0A7I8KSE8_SPIIN|nr:unnamed protein product [Spirodela intermedia]